MITLYHLPGRRSERVLWLLEELGLEYQLVVKEHEELLGDAQFLAASPLAKLPAMSDGSLTLFESGAIVEYLVTKYDNKGLMPETGTDAWAKCLQWIHASETIALPLGAIVQHTIRRAEADRVPKLAQEAREVFLRFSAAIEKELSQHDYIVGDDFSAADIMLAYGLSRAVEMKLVPAEQVPHLSDYVARVSSRPAFQKARQ